ncbi:hypothetical protein ACFOWM_00245 [Ferruginibacter yonginensis]|uniref:Thioredoxin domain-containing protein n=1 Tax=Ferruginibacter yonginensis TaxID=1310416 RepID=A0ABV8QLV3_9BACT
MKKLLLLMLVATFSTQLKAQQTSNTYRVVVMFSSECCGVPNEQPLLKAIAQFKKQHKIKKISYDNIGPIGREGEYYMAFRLKELNKFKTAAFIKMVNKVVPTLKDKGMATVEENKEIETSTLSSRTSITKKSL